MSLHLPLCSSNFPQLAVSALQELVGKDGKDALERMHVILHVNEEQQEDVLEELHSHSCYG